MLLIRVCQWIKLQIQLVTKVPVEVITEALSKYYYANGESFSELFVAPEYQERFEQLANDAIYYYDE